MNVKFHSHFRHQGDVKHQKGSKVYNMYLDDIEV